MIPKIGFCCKYKASDDLSLKEQEKIEKQLNTKTTTVSAVKNLNKKHLFAKLEPILIHNLEATKKIINYIKQLPPELKMFRLSSDLLPLYTHDSAISFWRDAAIQEILQKEFYQIGFLIKNNKIRTGFHPGQFCVLNSNNKKTLDNSIKEFEYHLDLARWMGYSKWHEDGFYCNIHVGGKKNGIESFVKNLPRLSFEAKNLITVENDEYSFGLDDCLVLKDKIALVLDVHHHWCKTGEYIKKNDPRIDLIIESWRGIRPLLHYSISERSLLPNQSAEELPNLSTLKKAGYKVSQLRVHSQDYWNKSVNNWVAQFLDNFDIELECKLKNQAAINFFNEINKNI